MHLKILHRLVLAPATAVICLIALGCVTLLTLHGHKSVLDEIHVRILHMEQSTAINQSIAAIQTNTYRMFTWLSTYDAKKIEALSKEQGARLEKISTDLNALIKTADPVEKKLLEGLLIDTNKYKKQVLQAIDLASGDQNMGMMSMQSADQQYVKVDAGFDELVAYARKAVESQQTNATASIIQTQWTTAMLLLFAVLLSGWVSLATSRGLLRQLGGEPDYASKIAKTIASGDLSLNIRVATGDEHSILGNLNIMQGRLRAMVIALSDEAKQLSESANALSTSTNASAISATQQSDAASTMASAVEQMTVSVSQMADNAKHVEALTAKSGQLAAEGGSVIHSASRDMTEIASTIHQTASIMGDLEQHSTNIASIVQVIKEVADQTNLLALNAAIEAARAGEQGRGFAVVADEVRKLAERTSQATGQITEKIKSIQDSARSAAKSMQESVTRVTEGVTSATAAGCLIDQINSDAVHVAETVREMGAAIREQAATSTSIASSVESVARMSVRNTDLASQGAKESQRVHSLSNTLKEAIGRFSI